MTDRIRIIKHEAIPGYGSFEVKIEGQPSKYFYWDDLPSRRLSPICWTVRRDGSGKGCGRES